MKRTCPIGVVVLVLSAAMPSLAQSRDSGVRDTAKMFSPDAVRKADERLKALQRDGGWQVFIETVDALKNQTIEQRALADARALNAHGLVIAISKTDHKLDVQPSRSAEKVFSKEKVTGIMKTLRDAFRDKQFDKGLLDAVALIEDDARVVGVHDSAKMFSADAVKKANEALKALRQTSKWQVIIETVDSLQGQTPAERAIANGKAMNVHGLSIVISKGDHKLDVQPSRSAEKVFSKEKAKAIEQTIERDFRAKEFDKGLLDAVAAIQADAAPSAVASTDLAKPVTAAKAAPPARPSATENPPEPAKALPPPLLAQPVPAAEPPRSGSILPLLVVGGIGILALLWIMSRVMRKREPAAPPENWQQQPQPGYGPQGTRPVPPQGYAPPRPGYGPQPGYGPGYGPPPPQQGGGMGSFAAGALGGLGGAIAGNILYDQFGRPHHGGTPNVAPPDHAAGGVLPPSQPNVSPEAPHETFDPNAGASGDWGGDESQPAPAADQWADAGAGGDWGGEPASSDAGASGDWGGNEPDTGASGDWGGGSDDAAGASGDWGGDGGSSDDGGSGDWGGDAPDAPDPDQGGGW